MTIIDRDLREVLKTNLSFNRILDFLKQLALNEGSQINFKKMQRATKLSEETQKNLLFAFEALFLIRQLPIRGSRKGFVCWLEDQAESYFLNKEISTFKNQLIGLLYRNLRTQIYYELGNDALFFSYQTRGGAEVPICIESAGKYLGFILTTDVSTTKSQIASAHSFLKEFSDSKVIITGPKISKSVLHPRILQIPLADVI